MNYSQLYRKFSFLESLVDKEFIFLAADSIDTLVETPVLAIVFTLHSNVVWIYLYYSQVWSLVISLPTVGLWVELSVDQTFMFTDVLSLLVEENSQQNQGQGGQEEIQHLIQY